jgi:hypothetical protein
MPYEPRNNSGVMFPNSKKPASSKQPDFRKTILADGAEYETSAWERDGRRGRILSLAVQVAGAWRTREQAGS